MKTVLALLIGLSLVAGNVTISDATLSRYAQHTDELDRVTLEPQKMDSITAMLCAPPSAPDPHGDKFINVFVSKAGLPIVLSGKGVYPVGTVILKAKYPDRAASKAELYTGMLKREKGFNPKGGDWEYFMVSGDGKKVIERGALQSCMGCHSSYSSTDYVSRNYAPLKATKP